MPGPGTTPDTGGGNGGTTPTDTTPTEDDPPMPATGYCADGIDQMTFTDGSIGSVDFNRDGFLNELDLQGAQQIRNQAIRNGRTPSLTEIDIVNIAAIVRQQCEIPQRVGQTPPPDNTPPDNTPPDDPPPPRIIRDYDWQPCAANLPISVTGGGADPVRGRVFLDDLGERSAVRWQFGNGREFFARSFTMHEHNYADAAAAIADLTISCSLPVVYSE